MNKRKDTRPANPHLAHGEPIAKILSDGSTVYDCPCGYGYENLREARTGHAYDARTIGATIVVKPWDAAR